MLKYRHTTPEDIPKIDEWVSVDPVHKDTMKGSDFVLAEGEKGTQCIEVQDEAGATIFYLRFRNALIVETQFPPESSLRTAKALKEALAFFMASSKKLGYHALFFNSMSEGLIRFFEKLGFHRVRDYFKVEL